MGSRNNTRSCRHIQLPPSFDRASKRPVSLRFRRILEAEQIFSFTSRNTPRPRYLGTLRVSERCLCWLASRHFLFPFVVAHLVAATPAHRSLRRHWRSVTPGKSSGSSVVGRSFVPLSSFLLLPSAPPPPPWRRRWRSAPLLVDGRFVSFACLPSRFMSCSPLQNLTYSLNLSFRFCGTFHFHAAENAASATSPNTSQLPASQNVRACRQLVPQEPFARSFSTRLHGPLFFP